MISDYDREKRRLTPAMAKRIAEILDIKVKRISWRGQPHERDFRSDTII